jgi:hypothetical protein
MNARTFRPAAAAMPATASLRAGPRVRTAGRAECTVKAEGCGRSRGLPVICALEGEDCYVSGAGAK